MRLSDKAYHLIRQKIITLELPPLSAIDEQALVESLALGRTPIREALQRLVSEGLIFNAPRRGMFVTDVSITDYIRYSKYASSWEGFCARLAAQRASSEQIAEMKQVIDDLALVPDGDGKGLMLIDERFDEALYQAAANELLADTLRRLHALSFRTWHLFLHKLPAVKDAIEQHVEIFRALEQKDEAKAEMLLQQHVTEFQRRIKAVL